MIHAFGEFELDDGLFELRRSGEVLKLPPKTFDLLLYLVRHRDRVVSKSELLDKLWPGEHVTEAVLPTNVSAARAALRDSRGRSGMIQTVHGRGYRFVAPVEEHAAGLRVPSRTASEARLFVGREDVMAELRALLDDCFAGSGRVALLSGEPGIGKTCTAERLADEARRRGALVLEGRATEAEGVPAFWPWVRVLRGLALGLTLEELRDSVGPAAAELARLVPELRQQIPELPDPGPEESAQARFRLFDAVATVLRGTNRTRALVLFLDDLHWADEPTLLLLQFVAREIRDARVLLLGAYRDVELRRQHPLARVLGELAREAHHRRISLGGLEEQDVARFVEASTGRPASAALVAAVFRRTEGNPFFVHETVRLLASEGRLEGEAPSEAAWDVGLPEGVREVIGRRLDRLSEECNQALTRAAVIGREFDVPLLARVCEQPPARVLDLLDEAESARIVVPAVGGHRTPSPGCFAFGHALVRETLYEELTVPQRVRLHRRVAESLEALGGERTGTHLAELARQFFQAAPGGDVERALAYCVRAGEHALELLAWEEAVAHFERALQAIELAVPVEEAHRCELVLALGRAQWQAGHYPEGRRTFSLAATLARKLDRADLLAEAAIGLGGWPQFFADEPRADPPTPIGRSSRKRSSGCPATPWRCAPASRADSLATPTCSSAGNGASRRWSWPERRRTPMRSSMRSTRGSQRCWARTTPTAASRWPASSSSGPSREAVGTASSWLGRRGSARCCCWGTWRPWIASSLPATPSLRSCGCPSTITPSPASVWPVPWATDASTTRST
ncbi:MAG: AAA family ATPase [Myxococcota bacterium]